MCGETPEWILDQSLSPSRAIKTRDTRRKISHNPFTRNSISRDPFRSNELSRIFFLFIFLAAERQYYCSRLQSVGMSAVTSERVNERDLIPATRRRRAFPIPLHRVVDDDDDDDKASSEMRSNHEWRRGRGGRGRRGGWAGEREARKSRLSGFATGFFLFLSLVLPPFLSSLLRALRARAPQVFREEFLQSSFCLSSFSLRFPHARRGSRDRLNSRNVDLKNFGSLLLFARARDRRSRAVLSRSHLLSARRSEKNPP